MVSGVLRGIEWKETGQALYDRYRTEQDVAARKRLGALWLVRSGASASRAAHLMGVGRRTLTRWLGWYRAGGLDEVVARVPGHGATGAAGRLSDEQLAALYVRSSQGMFRTYQEARAWVRAEWGIEYSYQGMYAVLARLGVQPKVPRPTAAKADQEAQAEWQKGGSETH
jgi:transposase